MEGSTRLTLAAAGTHNQTSFAYHSTQNVTNSPPAASHDHWYVSVKGTGFISLMGTKTRRRPRDPFAH